MYFGWGSGGQGVGFAFAENAFEGGTGEPDEVGAGVHVERDGLGRVGAESEGEGVVAARGEWERDLAALLLVVAVETSGGAGGGGFEEVVGTVELGCREEVGQRQEHHLRE